MLTPLKFVDFICGAGKGHLIILFLSRLRKIMCCAPRKVLFCVKEIKKENEIFLRGFRICNVFCFCLFVVVVFVDIDCGYSLEAVQTIIGQNYKLIRFIGM